MKTQNRKPWQRDPCSITDKVTMVTIWNQHGIMLTGQARPADARKLVLAGKAYVISDGHIGLCD